MKQLRLTHACERDQYEPTPYPEERFQARHIVETMCTSFVVLHFPYAVDYFHVYIVGGVIHFQIQIFTPDREGFQREPVKVRRDYAVAVHVATERPEYIYRALREMLRDLLVHELDEMILVAGERMFDPHPRHSGGGG